LSNLEQVRDSPDGFSLFRSTMMAPSSDSSAGQLGRPGLRGRVRTGGLTIEVISVHLKWELLTFPGGRFSPRNEKERTRYAVWALHRRAAEAPPAFDLM
jgi:hypothetical protein